MELKLNSGDVITIPDDCKAVIKDKIITVEKAVQEFKDGDFIYSKALLCELIMIYKGSHYGRHTSPYVFISKELSENDIYYNGSCGFENTRLATEEEKQLLLDALHADGKDWDADKKQIVDYKLNPKIGDAYYYIDCFLDVVDDIWSDDRMDDLVYTSGNCFKTEEEAQKYADKFSEILKDRKL